MAPFSALGESRAGLRFAQAYSCAEQYSMPVVRLLEVSRSELLPVISPFVRIYPTKPRVAILWKT